MQEEHSLPFQIQVSQGSFWSLMSFKPYGRGKKKQKKTTKCSSDLKDWLTFLRLLPFQAPVLPLVCRGEVCDQRRFFAISVNAHIYSGPLKQPMAFRIRV